MAEPRELDALLELARCAEPPALGALPARRMVRHAQEAALARGRRRTRASYGLLCAAALLAIVAGYAWQRPPAATSIAVGADDRPLRIALKTGDSLVLAPGSELTLLEQRAERRRVRLTRGRALFDVAKLGAGQGFEVQAESARVRVLGTVFSVEVGEGRTLVRVYEGRVAVGGRVLAAPGVWVSRGAPPQQADALLEHEARQLVRARRAEPQVARSGASPSLAEPVVAPVSTVSRVAPPAPRESLQPPAARAVSAGGDSFVSAARPSSSSTSVGSAVVAASDPSASAYAPAPESDSEPAPARPDATATPGVLGGATFEIERARALLASGDARAALELALPHVQHDDEALLLAADAWRALGQHQQARADYLALARRSVDPVRTRAAFAAAQLALYALGDPADALWSIGTFALNAERAPLRERATALEVDALLALGRREEARAAARRYLAREPQTETSRRMRELIGEAWPAR